MQLKNPTIPQFTGYLILITPYYLLLPEEFEKVDAKVKLSPRINMSYQLDGETEVHFNAGVFYQIPSLKNLYFNTVLLSENLILPFLAESPAFDIVPIKSTNFELGFHKIISNKFEFNINSYYRKIDNQVGFAMVATESNSIAAYYNITQSNDNSTIKGIELLTGMKPTNRVSGWASFSYQHMNGIFHEADHISAISGEPGIYSSTTKYHLDFNQAFRGALDFNYRFGKNDGGSILENSAINALFTFNSGHPYNFLKSYPGYAPAHLAGLSYLYDPRFIVRNSFIRNAGKTPLVSEWHLRISKKFNFGRIDITLYTYIQNILNSKNDLNVYETTGDTATDGFLSNPGLSQAFIDAFGLRYADLYRKINLNHRQHLWELASRDNFNTPRQVRFGLNINF